MQIQEELRGKLPQVDAPAPFASANGQIQGWKVSIPGNRPLATPAVIDGRVFVGGGFGSYEFYAFDAHSGSVVWQYQTNDDGPTAAVVQDGFVVFNTESCELEVLTVEGKPVWKKWLGDPLMSMPALDQGRVYIVYPKSMGDHHHYLACFDLKSGQQSWERQLVGEIISAPVIAEGQVYLTAVDGTLYCFKQDDGELIWHEPKNATSSPVVWEQQCYFSQRKEMPINQAGRNHTQQMESIMTRGTPRGSPSREYGSTATAADYLDHAKRKARSKRYADYELHEAAVGFAHFKGDAKMEQSIYNLGHGQVSSLWAYQGSKPFVYRGRLFSAIGDSVHCVEPKTAEVLWKKKLHETKEQEEILDHIFTPPALVNGKLFLGTITGDVYCVSAESAEVLWQVNVGEPVVFQPAVAKGRVYVPTGTGSLFCLETNDPMDDGWLMWGATAAHNGQQV